MAKVNKSNRPPVTKKVPNKTGTKNKKVTHDELQNTLDKLGKKGNRVNAVQAVDSSSISQGIYNVNYNA